MNLKGGCRVKYRDFNALFQYPSNATRRFILDMNSTNKFFLEFKKFVGESTIEDLQEKYTHTFDMNPSTSLDLGWHLYGEAYERGAFLVKLRGFLSESKTKESSELPDHITHIFKVMDNLDESDQDGFLNEYIVPALKKIINGFDGSDNPYELTIKFILSEINNGHECMENINGNL